MAMTANKRIGNPPITPTPPTTLRSVGVLRPVRRRIHFHVIQAVHVREAVVLHDDGEGSCLVGGPAVSPALVDRSRASGRAVRAPAQIMVQPAGHACNAVTGGGEIVSYQDGDSFTRNLQVHVSRQGTLTLPAPSEQACTSRALPSTSCPPLSGALRPRHLPNMAGFLHGPAHPIRSTTTSSSRRRVPSAPSPACPPPLLGLRSPCGDQVDDYLFVKAHGALRPFPCLPSTSSRPALTLW